MIDSAVGLFEMRGAVTADQQQALCKINAMLSANAIKAFANGFRNGRRQALPC